MSRRILVLVGYFLRSLFFSLAGTMYTILALAYWVVFFPPMQSTPDVENYIIIIGAFGAAVAFLSTLSVAARANQAINYPVLVRLPSRIEYLTAVLFSALIFATSLQLLVALLSLYQGPALALGRALETPPIWMACNILAAVLAMHASDFVTAGWSRVYLFGLLALFLLVQSASESISRWLAARANGLGFLLISEGWASAGNVLNNLATWLFNSGAGLLQQVFGLVFWPFNAIAEGTLNGYFNPMQALAPAIILLYATVLFMLAADLFATKDLFFTE